MWNPILKNRRIHQIKIYQNRIKINRIQFKINPILFKISAYQVQTIKLKLNLDKYVIKYINYKYNMPSINFF